MYVNVKYNKCESFLSNNDLHTYFYKQRTYMLLYTHTFVQISKYNQFLVHRCVNVCVSRSNMRKNNFSHCMAVVYMCFRLDADTRALSVD